MGGAPAIGITVAYAVVLATLAAYQDVDKDWREVIETDIAQLKAARPTTVNLHWAIAKMQGCFDEISSGDPTPILLALAKRIHQDDITANHEIGHLGAALIEPASQVLTHCNAGALATGIWYGIGHDQSSTPSWFTKQCFCCRDTTFVTRCVPDLLRITTR